MLAAPVGRHLRLRIGTAGSPVAADPRRELVGGIHREVHRGLDAESGVARTQRPREPTPRSRPSCRAVLGTPRTSWRSAVGKPAHPERGRRARCRGTDARGVRHRRAVSPSFFVGDFEIPVVAAPIGRSALARDSSNCVRRTLISSCQIPGSGMLTLPRTSRRPDAGTRSKAWPLRRRVVRSTRRRRRRGRGGSNRNAGSPSPGWRRCGRERRTPRREGRCCAILRRTARPPTPCRRGRHAPVGC